MFLILADFYKAASSAQGIDGNKFGNLFSTIEWSSIPIQREKDTTNPLGEIILCFKVGYHSSNKEKQFDGFTDGLIFDFSAEGGLGKGWFTGIGFEYWVQRIIIFLILVQVLSRGNIMLIALVL